MFQRPNSGHQAWLGHHASSGPLFICIFFIFFFLSSDIFSNYISFFVCLLIFYVFFIKYLLRILAFKFRYFRVIFSHLFSEPLFSSILFFFTQYILIIFFPSLTPPHLPSHTTSYSHSQKQNEGK